MTSTERYNDIPLEKNSGNEGLPEGAMKFQDKTTAQLLEDMWRQETNFYNQTEICADAGLDLDRNSISGLKKFEVEISGPQSCTFKGQLHPKVENNSWYRGIAVKVEKDNPSKQVLIFSGWMQPWIKGETQAPIVYTISDVPDKTVHNVIYRYTSHILSTIDRLKNYYRIS